MDMTSTNIKRVIISGGGTGGHIFPAISIANALKELSPEIEILFVGAEGKIEMEKVPAAGYKIIGLPIRGFQRKFTFQNFDTLFKLGKSLLMANKIIKDFKPDVVVGVGGYASGPVLYAASRKGVPTVIQEQNSYAGVTNKILAKKAKKICVAYEGLEKFFPKEKIILTGNPVRKDLLQIDNKHDEAIKFFELDASKKTILILGGSLGARTLNNSVLKYWNQICELKDIQIIWQCGKLYKENIQKTLQNSEAKTNFVSVLDFISRMDLAYAAADVIISRAGAGTISELCIVAKPVILVPSPNVAEDHQTKNAMSLVEKKAAMLIKDVDAEEKLIPASLELIYNSAECVVFSQNIAKLAMTDSAIKIANEILNIE